MSDTFNALLLRQGDDKKTLAAVEEITKADLPTYGSEAGDVLLEVDYSTINYKDALAITGKGKIVRSWPLVPGIDLSGTVVESESDQYKPGEKVILTGWDVGEKYWGGLSQMQRVKSEWLVPMPDGLDGKKAMAMGTAGFTAILCVLALEKYGIKPGDGPVLVTGAAGGVGAVSVALLANLGYETVAMVSPGREHKHDFLKSLGATEIADGEEWTQTPRPLEGQRWAGGIDTVGSDVLARLIAETNSEGAVAACGLAGGFDLKTTVMPFILRGVALLGVNSVTVPYDRRLEAWTRLVKDLPENIYGDIEQTIGLGDVIGAADAMMNGDVKGRSVVDLKK